MCCVQRSLGPCLRTGDGSLKKQRDNVKSKDGTRGLKISWLQSPESLVDIVFIRSKQLRKKRYQEGGLQLLHAISTAFCLLAN